jgi:hypothetical protein
MIAYDLPSCQAALRIYLIGTLTQLQQELLAENESSMLTAEARSDLIAPLIKEMAMVLVAEVIGGAWAAMDEWGTGTLMDTSNPDFAEYRSSDMWNPARRDLAIRSRPSADGQRNIFGQSVQGIGKGGHLLEGSPGFEAQPPSHAMQTAIRWMVEGGRLQEVLQTALNTFPWGQFIVATRD